MVIKAFIYAKCEGLSSFFDRPAAQVTASSSTIQTDCDYTAMKAEMEDKILINYMIKYGSQTYSWVEHGCESLNKSKELSIDYRLGQAD